MLRRFRVAALAPAGLALGGSKEARAYFHEGGCTVSRGGATAIADPAVLRRGGPHLGHHIAQVGVFDAELRDLAREIDSIWEWEPLKPHARSITRVTATRWNGQSGRRAALRALRTFTKVDARLVPARATAIANGRSGRPRGAACTPYFH